jgi:NADH-ubiquinone oxidoreductase chain 3
MILPILNNFLAPHILSQREKFDPFECGFDPPSVARLPFSIQFYSIAVIFLVFDVEITLLIPIPISTFIDPKILSFLLVLFFLIILIAGIIYE